MPIPITKNTFLFYFIKKNETKRFHVQMLAFYYPLSLSLSLNTNANWWQSKSAPFDQTIHKRPGQFDPDTNRNN